MSSTNEIKVQKIAQKVLDNIKVEQNNDNFGFVITILMIISITLTLIRIIQECNKKKINLFDEQEKYCYFQSEIQKLTIHRSWFTKMIIKKAIRKEIGYANYKQYGVAIMNSILNIGENLTPDEIVTLVEAANV